MYCIIICVCVLVHSSALCKYYKYVYVFYATCMHVQEGVLSVLT